MKRFQLYPTSEGCLKITDIHTGTTVAILFDLDAAFECEKALNDKHKQTMLCKHKQHNQYLLNGGTMSLAEWEKDGRHDNNGAPCLCESASFEGDTGCTMGTSF